MLMQRRASTAKARPTSSSAGSRARTSASPVKAPDYPGAVRDSTGSWLEPFAWYDRDSQSWKTWQPSLFGGWVEFAETWPRSGMTVNGIAYRLPALEPLIDEIGSGLLPTPAATPYGNNQGGGA